MILHHLVTLEIVTSTYIDLGWPWEFSVFVLDFGAVTGIIWSLSSVLYRAKEMMVYFELIASIGGCA